MSPREDVLSVVVPVYGCQPCLRHLHERLTVALRSLEIGYEIVLVDDRAEDGSWSEIERLADLDTRVRGILLCRNFGQQAAITAGLHYARGAWVVVMDCDLQDPPEVIPQLYAKAMEGYDIVFGRRPGKPTSFARRQLGRLYFCGLRMLGETSVDGQHGAFSVISRKAVDALLALRERNRNYTAMLTWLRFATASVEYTAAPRYRGRSSYSISRLLELAVDGVFFQTTLLLRCIAYAGLCVAAAGGALAGYLLAARAFGSAYPGWTSIMTTEIVLGGFIILSTGITGLYLGKVFEQLRGRPVFVLDRVARRSPAGRTWSRPQPDPRVEAAAILPVGRA
jgi:glycosyltransferase involved in cell wall biosynthesis